MPPVPDTPGDTAGLRAANARLRELLAERDAELGELRALVAELQAQVADLTARVRQNSLLTEQGPVFPQLDRLAMALGCTVTARG